MTPDTSIEAQFAAEDAARTQTLDTQRFCAALSKPWILPPKDRAQGDLLPQPFQSILARGITDRTSQLLLDVYPPHTPWLQLAMAPEVRYAESISDEAKLAADRKLFLFELMIQAVLESATVLARNGTSGQNVRGVRKKRGFTATKRNVFDQLLITGDALERVGDDYRITLFRNDQYTTKRDSEGDVLHHCIRESIDPLSLGRDQVAKCNLKWDELAKLPPALRMKNLFTKVEWNPVTERWVTTQEVNKTEIATSEDPVSAFVSTTYELSPPDDYGHGFIELNLGDGRSLNEISEKLLDFAAMAAKHHPCKDIGSQVRIEDLAKPSGTPIEGARVEGGVVQDIGWIRVEKLADFQVVMALREAIRKELGGSLHIESEQQPKGERVTAAQVGRVAKEVERSKAGVEAQVADDQVIPMVQRTIYQLQKANKMPKLPEGAVEIRSLTGFAAVARQLKAQGVTELASVAQMLGPQALALINGGVLLRTYARYRGIEEAGVLKSPEQVAAETQAAIAAQTQLAAGEKAVDVAGNIVESQATSQAA